MSCFRRKKVLVYNESVSFLLILKENSKLYWEIIIRMKVKSTYLVIDNFLYMKQQKFRI